MKRLYLWLRELTLTQQLLTIAFLLVTVFAVFLLTVLTPQVNAFAETEMFRMLHNSQKSLKYYLALDSNKEIEFEDDENEIAHIIYKVDSDSYQIIGGNEFTNEEMDIISSKLNHTVTKTEDYSVYINENSRDRQKILFSITPVNDDIYLVSKLPASYEDTFKASLVNNIIDVNIFVVMSLFIALMLWVASLIHPLNQITVYINKIKNDDPALLTVYRRDEIGEVADALREMEFELSKQNREKQEMIQNISHDLKTPIATIKSYGESIKDGIYPYGTLEKSIDVIIEHADRLEKKVRSLIALNKMGYLLDDCAKGDTLNMNEVVDKVLLSLKVIRPEITFKRNMDEAVYFHGDEDPWRIVVENLVDNALRYATSTITISLHKGELCVINDGKQIAEDRIDKLFKPYEKGTDGQFGLGLSIVHKVVTTYGYHIEPENLADGVCFRIWKDLSKNEKREIEKEKKKEEKEKKAQVKKDKQL